MDEILSKIWQTKKVRINTENRLLKISNILEFLIPYYSLNLIIITLINNSQILDIISILVSLFILTVSIVLTNKDYKLRAYKIRQHYIELDKLYVKLKGKEYKEGIADEYFNALLEIENHSHSDFIKTIITLKNDKNSGFRKPVFQEYFIYYSGKVIFWIIIAVVVLLPLVVDVWMMLN